MRTGSWPRAIIRPSPTPIGRGDLVPLGLPVDGDVGARTDAPLRVGVGAGRGPVDEVLDIGEVDVGAVAVAADDHQCWANNRASMSSQVADHCGGPEAVLAAPQHRRGCGREHRVVAPRPLDDRRAGRLDLMDSLGAASPRRPVAEATRPRESAHPGCLAGSGSHDDSGPVKSRAVKQQSSVSGTLKNGRNPMIKSTGSRG